MSAIEPGGAPIIQPNIVARAMAMLTAPSAEWKKIDAEPATVQGLLVGYVVPLAAIPALAAALGGLLFGYGVPGLATLRPAPTSLVITGVLQFALMVGMTFLMALIIDGLASNFGARNDRVQALKTAAYAGTAAWLLSAAQIVPMLGIIGLAGIVWSVFLLNGGLISVMRAPAEKAFGYTASVTGAMLVAWIVGFMFIGVVGGAAALGGMGAAGLFGAKAPSEQQGSVQIGGTTVDLGKLEEAAKQMEEAAENMNVQVQNGGNVTISGGATAIDVTKLETLLPSSLPGGLAQIEISAGSSGAFGMGVGGVTGRYAGGDKTMELTVGDMAGMGAFAGLAGAFGAQSYTKNADGFERVGQTDGRLTMEKVSNSAKSASYAVVVDNRFVLSADGTNVSLDEVKAAVKAIDEGKLRALAQ